MVTLRMLLNEYKDEDFSILSGYSHIDTEVKNITSLESVKSVEKISSGLLVLTAGFLFENEDDSELYNYVNALIERKSVGLGLKTRFVHKIPEKTLELAEENGFIIFTVPNDLKWSDLFSEFYKLKNRNYDDNKAAVFYSDLDLKINHLRAKTTRQDIKKQDFLSIFKLPSLLISKNDRSYTNEFWDSDAKNNKKIERFIESVRLNSDGLADISDCTFTFSNEEHSYIMIDLSELDYLVLNNTDIEIDKNEVAYIRSLYKRIMKNSKIVVDENRIIENLFDDLAREDNLVNLNDFIQNKKLKRDSYMIGIASKSIKKTWFNRIREYMLQTGKFKGVYYYIYDNNNDDNFIIVGMDTECKDVQEIIREVDYILYSLIESDEGNYIYFGNPFFLEMEIQSAYKQAIDCKNIGENVWRDEPYMFYDNIEAINILRENGLDLTEVENMEALVENLDVINTLECYFENRNIREASEKLYIHQNTLRYRIRKIQEIYKIDVERPSTFFNCLVKIKVYRSLK